VTVEFHPDLVGVGHGDGPAHLLTPDAGATLCGRVQFGTYKRWAMRDKRDCKYCQAVIAAKPSRGQGLTDVDLDRLESALADMEQAITRIADRLRGTTQPPAGTIERKRYVLWLRHAQAAGLTYDRVAKMTGRTRERIRQIAAEEA
jgi:hypothetical protein